MKPELAKFLASYGVSSTRAFMYGVVKARGLYGAKMVEDEWILLEATTPDSIPLVVVEITYSDGTYDLFATDGEVVLGVDYLYHTSRPHAKGRKMKLREQYKTDQHFTIVGKGQEYLKSINE